MPEVLDAAVFLPEDDDMAWIWCHQQCEVARRRLDGVSFFFQSRSETPGNRLVSDFAGSSLNISYVVRVVLEAWEG
jgi:hypothetical protein